MKAKSSISYIDLIDEQQRLLDFMEKTYPGRVMAGSLSSKIANHRIECARLLIRILKKCQPGQPADMFSLYQSINKTTNVTKR